MKHIFLSLALVGCGNQVDIPEEIVIRHEIVAVSEASEAVRPVSEPLESSTTPTPETQPIAKADLSPNQIIPVEAAKAEVIPTPEKLPEGRCDDGRDNFYFARELVDGEYVVAFMIRGSTFEAPLNFGTGEDSGNRQDISTLFKDGLIAYSPRLTSKFLEMYKVEGQTEGRLRLRYLPETEGFTIEAWVDAGSISKRIYVCLVK